MSNDVTCRVLLKNFNDIKNLTLGETAPDFEYKCEVYQYCCYNFTVPHSPWCCDASYTVIYKDWYLWVILSLITVLILALFFYIRFYQKRQLEGRILRATLELEAHYRPLAQTQQVTLGGRRISTEDEDDKSWTTDDPPPCYSDIVPQPPPSYSSSKHLDTPATQDFVTASPRRTLPQVRQGYHGASSSQGS